MSAFIVSRQHIDALVELAWHGPSRAPQYPGDGYYSPSWFDEEPQDSWTLQEINEHRGEVNIDSADSVGSMLWRECVASVKCRYHDEPLEDLPGNTDDPYLYSFSPLQAHLSALQGLKAIACYEYQSCEHPGWRDSEAKRFCDSLKDSLIGQLPGYREASWEVASA